MIIEKNRENLLLWVALAVFYLNDFLYLFYSSPTVFYLSDYLLKGMLFIGIIAIFRRNNENIRYLQVPKKSIPAIILWTVALLVIGIFIDQIAWRYLSKLLPQFNWQLHFHSISNPFYKIFDLTIGIFLVAFTEEYIFRYLIVKKLRQNFSVVVASILSLVIFGFAHWSFGLTAIVSTMLWAVLPLISVLRLNSLVPAIIAHYLTNVISFSGVIEKIFGGG